MITNIKGSIKHIGRDLKVTQPDMLRKATVTSLTRANNKVFTTSKREVRAATGIAIKHFKGQLKKYPAKRDKLKASTWMGLKKRITLSAVNTGKKVNGKWTKYIKGSLEGKGIKDVFRAKMPTGHVGFFIRKDDSSANASGRDSKGRLRKNRLPIREVVLNIVDDVTAAINRSGDRVARPEFEKQMRHEINRRQKRIGTQ